MGYKILLFDLDDTLLDFGANEADSLTKLFRLHGYELTDDLFRVYNGVNSQLWVDYENGLIPLDDVLGTRFSKTMQKLGIPADGIEWENQYRELLGGGIQLMDGALEVCRRLSATHRLFVVSNGVAETQTRRMQLSGLSAYFEGFFYSQNIGYQKPSIKFFDHVMRHIPGFEKKDALIIGDSLNTDIKGGIAAGIDTCWIAPKPTASPADIQSTYTLTHLAQLYDICAREE